MEEGCVCEWGRKRFELQRDAYILVHGKEGSSQVSDEAPALKEKLKNAEATTMLLHNMAFYSLTDSSALSTLQFISLLAFTV